MSKQKISAVTREAIWIAYGKRCVYTQEHLDLDSMQIDHVIPESLLDEPHELQALLRQLGLPDDFDLLGLDNLVPARTRRNLQKQDLQFALPSLHYFLNIAASKKAAVEENTRRINARLEKTQSLILAQQMIEAGRLKPEDFASLLSKPSAEVFRLVKELEFSDATTIQAIEKSDLDNLRNRPVGLGGNVEDDGSPLKGLTLGNDAGNEKFVRTCADYDAALRDGFYPRTTYEITIASFFEHQCGLLGALAKATLPVKSFISEPRVGVSDTHLLPFWLFPDPAADANAPRPVDGPTYADRIEAGQLHVRRVGSDRLTVEDDGMRQSLTEVVRADFDGDGLEEVLVFQACYAVGGSLRYFSTLILRRQSADEQFLVSEVS